VAPGPEELNHVQQAFWDKHGLQCGFCTPGMVLSAIEAVRVGAAGSEEEIRHSLAGNLCRCTGYGKIVAAVAAYRDGAGAGDVPSELGTGGHRDGSGGEGSAPAPGVGIGP
jgi:aerobic-type carbon monoxide dehydrogenase small subunit (CoxS/CutS family)